MSLVQSLDAVSVLLYIALALLLYRFLRSVLGASSSKQQQKSGGSEAESKVPEWREEKEARVVGRIAALRIYPVKSLPGLSVPQLSLEAEGPTGDRRLMVARDEEEPLSFVTLRQLPRMGRIAVSVVGEAQSTLRLEYEGKEALEVPLKEGEAEEHLVGRVWDSQVACSAVSAAADKWLSDVLGAPLRLLRLRSAARREIEAGYHVEDAENITALGDGFPLLLASNASLKQLQEKAKMPVTMERFRPNIVVDADEPFDEDYWAEVKVRGQDGKEVVLKGVKACARCKIPKLDPKTCEENKQGEPNKTLLEIHKSQGKPKEAFFGLNLVIPKSSEGCVLRCGDQVVLTKRFLRSTLP